MLNFLYRRSYNTSGRDNARYSICLHDLVFRAGDIQCLNVLAFMTLLHFLREKVNV